MAYVLFDKKRGLSEVEVVEKAGEYLNEKIENGAFMVPRGVSFTFTGTYENQVRSEKRLAIILPVALLVIFVILYLQFNSAGTTMLVFYDQGEKGIERVAVSRYGIANFYKGVWNPDEMDQWNCLAKVVKDRDPKKIGINISDTFAFA